MMKTHRAAGSTEDSSDSWALLSALPFAALLVRASGEVVRANAQTEKLLGLGNTAVIGQSLGSLLPIEGEPAARLAPPLSRCGPVRCRCGCGASRPLEIELTLNPVGPAAGDLLLAVVRERARPEPERPRLVVRQMRAAARAASRIAAGIDLRHVVETVVQVLVQDFGAATSGVWLYDRNQDRLAQLARAGIEGGPAEAISPGADCPVARAATSRAPVIRAASGFTAVDAGWVEKNGIESVAALPLLAGGAVLGVLACFVRSAIDPALEEVLLNFASMLAAAAQERDAPASGGPAGRGDAASTERWLVFERDVAEARAGELSAANRALEDERSELQKAKRRLTAQYAVLEALTRSRDLREAAPRVLQAIGTHLGWEVGTFWALGDDAQLRAEHVWHVEGLAAEAFVERTRRMNYALGEGMVGRVFQSGEPAWTGDAMRAAHFRRGELAAREGLHGAIWFPVRHGNEVFGVIEFLRSDRGAPDDETLRATAALGHQIGQFAERVRAESALAEGERQLETTLRSIADAVLAVGNDGRVEFMNLAAEALIGMDLGDARGKSLAEVLALLDEESLAPLHPGGAWELLEARAEPGEPVALPAGMLLRAHEGTERLVDGTASPLRAAGGEVQGFVLVLRDVTRARRAERRARLLADASAELAASLDYAATSANVAQRVVGRLADWCIFELRQPDGTRRPLAMAHGDPSQTARLRELRERFAPASPDDDLVDRVLRTGQSLMLAVVDEAALARFAPDPEQRDCLRRLGLSSLLVVPVPARRQTIGAMVFASARPERRYDADDLATAEELARRFGLAVDNARLLEDTRDALRAREDFLSIASHELKTPLTSLQLYIQSLLRAVRDGVALESERVLEKLESAERQSLKLARLIQDLLDLSRVGSGPTPLDLQRVDLATVVGDVIEAQREAAERAGCRVTVARDGDVAGHWDPELIEQVAGNLLSNAIKYGAGKPIAVGLRAEGEEVLLEVADRGIGIAAGDRDRIFARFERAVSPRHFGGLGVGLYVVRCAVTALGGTVELDSEPGCGSTFRVRLPRGGPSADRAAGVLSPGR